MKRRNIELLLLGISSPIVIILFSCLVLTQGGTLSFNTLGVPIGILIAFLGAHFAIRKLAPSADPALLPIAFALCGVGMAFVTRLSPETATRQLIWLFAGIAVMVLFLALVRNLDKLAEYKYTFMIIGILLLLSPMLPIIGNEVNGSRLWLKLGPFSFQPGEIAKICIVLFLAGYLSQNREMLSVFTWKLGPFRLPSLGTLLPLLCMWALAFIVVVLEKDLGSALVLFLVFLMMLYVSTGKKFYVIIGFLMALIGAFLLYKMFGHVQTRVSIWLDPFKDAQNTGYQIVQSLYSLADGGMFGVGIGKGMCDYIPYVESDFIFSAIAEETGLLGASAVLLLYLCFAVRGICVAARSKSDISSFISVGALSIIILQAFIIVGGVTRLIPMTGITLPFISQGGSSLICGFLIVAILMRAGDEATGLGTEMKTSVISSVDGQGVLGRFSIGKRLTNVIILFSLMFAILVANLTYVMVIDAKALQDKPGNNHTMAKEAKTERGSILTHSGTVLARSEKQDDGTYNRIYPSGNLASHVVGYYSTKYGVSGIESSWNDTLKGDKHLASFSDLINSMAGSSKAGNDVKLSIVDEVQKAAQNALGNKRGSCVVMDPQTGAVLALASSPTYDANNSNAVLENASAKNSSKTSELLNRATGSVSGPGSTFKTVTLASAFSSGVADENTQFNSPGSMTIGNAKVTNFGSTSYGRITLKRAFELSSNTVFGQLGVSIGAQRLVKTAEDFGFNSSIDFDLPVAKSLMPDASEMTEWETAWSAAGEPVGEHTSPAGPQTNTLQMALVASAMANGGKIMKPYLVESVSNSKGETSWTVSPSVFRQPITKSVADRVLEVMKGVVKSGTGVAARVSGVTVAGKTGTAENAGKNPDSWFIGIADADGAKNVVVSIEIEEADEGQAAINAKQVIKTALKAQGVSYNE